VFCRVGVCKHHIVRSHPYIDFTTPPCSLLDARAASAPFFAHPPPLCPPPAHHASGAALMYVFSPHVFHVFHFLPPQHQPGCSLFSSSFVEASARLCCQPPPAYGSAPVAALVCLADHFFVLRIIWQRFRYQMGTDNGDARTGEEKGTQ